MNRPARIVLDWALPLAILAAATAFLRSTSLDIDIERAFFRDGWYRANEQPWSFLYHYGVVPAWVVSLGALALWVSSRWKRRIAADRRVFLYLALVMVVGPGLVVNAGFKDHWGRPRPMDLPEFGGHYAFVTVWDKGSPDQGASFPSGHASAAFYFFAVYFALRGRSRWAWLWLVVTLCYGSLMGLARMIQGKHFLSDVIWAAGFVYIVAVSLYYGMRLPARGDQ